MSRLGSGHALPPKAAGVTTVATSICTPPPHEAEHWPTGAGALKTQSTGAGVVGATVVGVVGTGHACTLHGVT